MADTFSKPQAIRLFGFIGAGASIGGLAGPALTTLLVKDIGTENLMLIAALLVVLALPLVAWVQRLKQTDLHNGNVSVSSENVEFIGGNPLAGPAHFVR